MNEKTNEHNPDGLTPEQYGAPEWRLLRKDEETAEGDEMRRYDGLWISAGWPMSVFAGHPVTYRRRVSPTLAEQSARIAELERRVEELTEENARLNWANKRMDENVKAVYAINQTLLTERDKLRAEVERLKTQLAEREEDRKDLDWLETAHWGISNHLNDDGERVWMAWDNHDDDKIATSHSTLRAAIRAARAQPEDGK